MTATVWLVRHASTAWTGRRWCGSTDLRLTAGGRVEADRLAERLAPMLPSDIELVSSPARRASETAVIIARMVGSGASVRIDPALREVDFGEAEGLTWRRLEQRLPTIAAALASGAATIDWPGGESIAAMQGRVSAIRSAIEAATAPVVLVGHGGLIRSLVAHMVPSHTDIAFMPPASATRLHRDGSSWTILGARIDA